LKVGDKVYCNKIVIERDSYALAFTVGKWYTIKDIIDYFIIVLDNKDMVFAFSETDSTVNQHNEYLFSEYFYTQKDIRKQKLDEIESR